jgi:hypothetical protein
MNLLGALLVGCAAVLILFAGVFTTGDQGAPTPLLVALGGAMGFLAAFGTLCVAFILFWFAAMLNGVVRMTRANEAVLKMVTEQRALAPPGNAMLPPPNDVTPYRERE